MGLKVAVVGGGSTYTPGAGRGLRAPRRRAARSTSWCCSTPTRSGSRSSAGSPAGSCARRGWPGRLTLTGDRSARPSTARRSRSSSCGSAGRPRGWSTRRSPTGSALIGQETTGPGGFAKALRTVPLVLDIAEEAARPRRARARGSSTSPTRSGSSPRRCWTPGTARSGCATWRSGSSAGSRGTSASTPERGPARPRRPQPPVVDPGRLGRRRRPAAGAARGRRRRW